MKIIDWLKSLHQEAEGAAWEPVPEETWVGDEQVPEGEIVTEGEGDQSLPTIRRGDRGETVTTLQTALNDQGYDCGEVDGIYGRKTKAAVEAFQRAHSLKVDGICGRQTWTALGLMEAPVYADGTQPPDFKQYDSRWGKKMYSNHGDKGQTMASSGCGPTAMADIVAAWWDASVTPYDLALKSLEWGTRTYDSGTTSTFFRKAQALYHAAKYQTTSSLDAAIDCLQQGGLVIICFGPGKSGSPGYKKWTKGGHYTCCWKYDGEYFYINDPASASAARAKGTRAEVQNARKGFYLFWK